MKLKEGVELLEKEKIENDGCIIWVVLTKDTNIKPNIFSIGWYFESLVTRYHIFVKTPSNEEATLKFDELKTKIMKHKFPKEEVIENV